MIILETRDLKYAYPDGTMALDGIDIEIEKGKRIAFVGPNGSGKSTLFLLLNGTLKPRQGEVLFQGRPIEYYTELARSLVEAGLQIWILGSDKDKISGGKIADSNSEVYNLCGRTQLADTIDLLACAKSVVSNDSGLMHVAAAAGVEVNVIYGSSTPDYTPPLTTDNKKNIFYLGLDCSPCFKRVCPLGHTNCLRDISYIDVFKKIYKHD